MNNKIENIYISQLYDIYGVLLTEKQQSMINLYYNCDTSLQEIAQEYQITRQAVLDNLNRSTVLLNNYEAKLNIFKNKIKVLGIITESKATFKNNSDIMQILNKLDSVLEDF